MSTFPVMDGDKVVGMVSDREIFVTLFKILEAEEDRTRITLTNVALERGTLTKILSTVEETGAKARSIFTVPEDGSDEVRVVLRLEADDPAPVFKALEDKGYKIMEASSNGGNGMPYASVIPMRKTRYFRRGRPACLPALWADTQVRPYQGMLLP